MTRDEVDAADRPATSAHGCTVEVQLAAAPEDVYRAWTEQFDRWFAQPGSVRMRAVVGEPFFFTTEFEGARHPHYGRFLTFEPERLVELSWMTGDPGTHGAETVVRLALEPSGTGSSALLTHGGFRDADDAERHRSAWHEVLAHLDRVLGADGT
jgi:uncharacterized protein YndB with AHSA1/START domain